MNGKSWNPRLATRGLAPVLTIGVAILVAPSLASAHLERPSYWPDPRPDNSVTPPAGGKVPALRDLPSAVTGAGPGKVLVVCQGRNGSVSLRRLARSLRVATTTGFRVRPSQPKVRLTRTEAARLAAMNRALAARCRYNSIQDAVFDAGNNDRVVILPGHYREPKARRQPINDPRCVPSLLQRDASGDLTPSYEYQVTCPNDQNLIYVQGREVVGKPPEPPLEDRRGIPAQELGPCVRCNLQMEGTGPQPTDVLIDGGSQYKSNDPEAKPGRLDKDVIIRADRADGFVVYNLTTRGAREHGIYIEETDGYRIQRAKMFWAADYGNLTFTSDHGLYQDCDSFGAGDAALYPGAAPETGAQTSDFYPDGPRKNTVITKCDMRGSALGYSGSMGNAVRITGNHIYGNTTGISSDTLSAAGHPGFPSDSSQIDHNLIYSNNLDLFKPNPPIKPLVGVPVGTGIIYPGMNNARVHDNWIFDNWRNGVMLFAVPDAFTNGGGAEGLILPGVACPGAPANGISTSCDNRFFRNRMGQAPRGFRFPKALDQFGVAHGRISGRSGDRRRGGRRGGSPRALTGGPVSFNQPAGPSLPNGTDFWWDNWDTNTGNCWFNNTGSDGTARSVTGPGLPNPVPRVLPSDCATSVGTGNPAKLAYLVECADGPDQDTGPMDCDWWDTPPRPGSAAAKRKERRTAAAVARWSRSPEAAALKRRLARLRMGITPEQLAPRMREAPFGNDGVGPVRAGSTAQFAACRDWRRGTKNQRYVTIAHIRGQLTPQSATQPVSPLFDEDAYRMFEKVCTTPGSDSLRLYKLYARAQVYGPLKR
jgi:hypothetical protein